MHCIAKAARRLGLVFWFPLEITVSNFSAMIVSKLYASIEILLFSKRRLKPKKPEKKGEKAPPVENVTVKDLLEQFELHPPQDMAPCKRLYEIFKVLFLNQSVNNGLIDLLNLSLAGDGTPVYTAAQERKKRTCNCLENGIRDCKCDRAYTQPDCNIGWDSHRECYYFGYDSRITDRILPEVKEWQSRPLNPVYPFVFTDCIHYKVREDGRILSRAAYIVLGITTDGYKEILSITVGANETSK